MAEYHVENFGCRASQADGAAISASLQQRGLTPAGSLAHASVVILNTCSVTAEADREARRYLRKARRANPDVRVIVTGCYAQRASHEIAALPGVDCVIGNSHKAMVAEIAAGLTHPQPAAAHTLVPLSTILVDDSFAHAELAFLAPSGFTSSQTRPNLKIQDGCGNRCSFCVIPQTRGNSRSLPLDQILLSVHTFVQTGGQEMVLSGINLGRWGRDLPTPLHFQTLVEAILTETRLPRLRISSVEPMDWSDRLLDLYRTYGTGPDFRLARHAHLPLQSGSDRILRAMYRRYRPWHYAAKVQAIRHAMPDAAIGADVMVGFPGETDALFDETCRFIEQQPFTYLHLFPFSARPGTPAWSLHQHNPVPGEAVRERMARLRALADEKHCHFRARFLGRTLSAVTLQSKVPDRTPAISDNFLAIDVSEAAPANQLVSLSITGITEIGLSGCLDGLQLHPITKVPDGILTGRGPSSPLLEEHHR